MKTFNYSRRNKNFFITNCLHVLTLPFLISWQPTHLWLSAHLLIVTVNVGVATPIWPTPRFWTEGSSATDFYLEKSRPDLRPNYPPIKLVLGVFCRVTDCGTKLIAFFHPVPRLRMNGAIPLRPLCALSPQYACDMCRCKIKQWAERCRCGCLRRRLARHSDQTELAGWLGGTLQTANTKERDRNVILFNLHQKFSTPRYCGFSVACYSVSLLQ
jgi:hypothetical protein